MPDDTDEQPPTAVRLTLHGKTYVFSEDTADNVELIDLERVTGWDTGEVLVHLSQGSMLAITAIVWMLRRRDEPGLAFGDVRFKTSELALEYIREGGEGKAGSNGSSMPTSSRSLSTSASSPGRSADSVIATI